MTRLLLKLCLGVSAAAILVVAQKADSASSVKKLSADELKKMVDSKQKFFFLDVREPKELEEQGTIVGYVNIPLSQVEQRCKEIPKDALVVTACSRGRRAATAAAILEKNGYKVIGACGMLEYKDKGYPLIFPKADGLK